MKTFISSVIAILMLLSGSGCTTAQSPSSEKEISTMLKEFYTSYITLIATGPVGADGEKEIHSLQEKYCTKSLLEKLPAIMESKDEDPFIKAQDSNAESLQTLIVTKVSEKTNEYAVSYNDITSNTKITINVRVVKEDESYKIDSVW